MNKLKNDPTGLNFGRLTVINRVENTPAGKSQFLCKCECGNFKIISRAALRLGTKSCGCLRSENARKRQPFLDHSTHGLSRTRIYRIWKGMKARCTCVSGKAFVLYGSRGITVCDEWRNDFQAFHDWSMSNGYAEHLTIDRIDNDKGYSPDNCRWATYGEQNKNKRRRENVT